MEVFCVGIKGEVTVSYMRRDQLLLGMTVIYVVSGWLHFFNTISF